MGNEVKRRRVPKSVGLSPSAKSHPDKQIIISHSPDQFGYRFTAPLYHGGGREDEGGYAGDGIWDESGHPFAVSITYRSVSAPHACQTTESSLDLD